MSILGFYIYQFVCVQLHDLTSGLRFFTMFSSVRVVTCFSVCPSHLEFRVLALKLSVCTTATAKNIGTTLGLLISEGLQRFAPCANHMQKTFAFNNTIKHT